MLPCKVLLRCIELIRTPAMGLCHFLSLAYGRTPGGAPKALATAQKPRWPPPSAQRLQRDCLRASNPVRSPRRLSAARPEISLRRTGVLPDICKHLHLSITGVPVSYCRRQVRPKVPTARPLKLSQRIYSRRDQLPTSLVNTSDNARALRITAGLGWQSEVSRRSLPLPSPL